MPENIPSMGGLARKLGIITIPSSPEKPYRLTRLESHEVIIYPNNQTEIMGMSVLREGLVDVRSVDLIKNTSFSGLCMSKERATREYLRQAPWIEAAITDAQNLLQEYPN